MKFTLACVLALVVLSTNGASSSPAPGGFCKHKVPTDGKQIKSGSCSSTVQGDIPSVRHMVSTIITNPPDHSELPANKPFKVEVLVSNLITGHFSDPNKEYYAEPQQLGEHGHVKGHLHVTIQKIDTQQPPDPQEFAFFKGLEDQARRGRLSTDVVQSDGTPGLSAGNYRICTMSSSFTHQPLIMPVAKRGSQDDCIRITVGVDKIDEEVGKQNGTKGNDKEEVGKQKDTKGNDKQEEVGKQKDTKGKEVGKQKDTKGKEVGKQQDTKGKEVGKQQDTKGNDKKEVGKQEDPKSIQVGKQNDIIDYAA